MGRLAAAPVLVTGALGAIGCWVIRRMLEEGRPFVAYDWRTDFSLLPDLYQLPLIRP